LSFKLIIYSIKIEYKDIIKLQIKYYLVLIAQFSDCDLARRSIKLPVDLAVNCPASLKILPSQ
jgi:predicted nucleic-acid-binding protein